MALVCLGFHRSYLSLDKFLVYVHPDEHQLATGLQHHHEGQQPPLQHHQASVGHGHHQLHQVQYGEYGQNYMNVL